MADRLTPKAGAGAGSNRPDLSMFRTVVREIVVLEQERDSATSAYMNKFKAAKKAGFNTKALAKAIAARREDADVVAANLEDQLLYMAWSGISVRGFQPDMFDDRPTVDGLTEKERLEETIFDAEQAGYATGRAGGDRVGANAHPAGSERHVAFDKGFLRGMGAIAREMAPPTEVKKVAAGRKKKGGNAENGPPKEAA